MKKKLFKACVLILSLTMFCLLSGVALAENEDISTGDIITIKPLELEEMSVHSCLNSACPAQIAYGAGVSGSSTPLPSTYSFTHTANGGCTYSGIIPRIASGTYTDPTTGKTLYYADYKGYLNHFRCLGE